jgi:glutathione S-transferase
MKLFGSTTSPFVRRIRLLLAHREYEFINMDIFSAEAREALTAQNPAQKIPYLEDGEQVIYDSRIIYQYLTAKLELAPISWQQQNTLTLVDAANDSLVQLLLLSRSGFNLDDDKMYFSLQKGRVREVLAALDKAVAAGEFNEWHYPSICLYCLIDWLMFRELYDLTAFNHLNQFWQQAKHQPLVQATDPRN